MTDKYTVFGNPIAQSKSPIIHAMFAKQFGMDIRYDKTFATPDNFVETIESFFEDSETKGCNITSPFKEQVSKWVGELSNNAKLAGAVNTVIRKEDGRFLGDTTDGPGLVQDLLRLGVCIKGIRVLLLGAGGAARGVLQSILNLAPDSLVIANRTESKAKLLASLIPQNNFIGIGFDELNSIKQPFDLIINSTTTSLSGELPPIADNIISQSTTVYDMSYGDKPTILMDHAQNLGVNNTFDGLGMLVGQAAESFYLWKGVRPDVDPVIKTLRSTL
ncbi:shikimate dehydrogenase [uncultured Paraglaciecola sp.]|uniref:shikimate dehydrogenase n=1 Tax=uncultured Paraglaciecola sp. TaxID=1765024 RepID=UPI0025992020|nr:shikimate dehydrogenase [uncultured Paraglaciecola sp.]